MFVTLKKTNFIEVFVLKHLVRGDRESRENIEILPKGRG